MKFALIDCGGRVWGPFTCPNHMSRYISNNEFININLSLLHPTRNFKLLRRPFICRHWSGDSFLDYDLPHVKTWRQLPKKVLRDFRKRISDYIDPSNLSWRPYYNGPEDFSVIDYGGKVWGPFSNRRKFEVFFGYCENTVANSLRRREPSRLVYNKNRPCFIVPSSLLDEVPGIPQPSNEISAIVKELVDKELPVFRRLMAYFVSLLRKDRVCCNKYQDSTPSFRFADRNRDKSLPKDKYNWVWTSRLPTFPGRITPIG